MSDKKDPIRSALMVLNSTQDKFEKMVAAAKTDVVFKTEMLYASQAMLKNDYLCTTALNNPLSLRNAFQQLAAGGLTLNPSRQLAYLVPREGTVILDVSWRGMVRTAVLDGSIRDCIVELVYTNDKFEYRGKRQSPIHTFNPFDKKADRGEFLGCYVEAALPDGRVHVEVVTAETINVARDASDMWRRKKKGPWVDHEDAMRKKAAIKAAHKYWPHVGNKLDEVIHYLNTTAGEGYKSDDVPVEVLDSYINGTEGNAKSQPLPTSNEVLEGEVVEAETPAAQEQQPEDKPESAPQPTPSDEASESQTAAAESVSVQEQTPELPEKVVKKVAEIIRRATLQGAWSAAREHISSWPQQDARIYGLKALKAAEYAAVSQGE